ncbi:MAG: amino acid permease, partial [Bacteroidota bacterium]
LILLGFLITKNADVIAKNMEGFWQTTWTHMADGKVVSVEVLSGWMLMAALGTAMVGSLFASDSWHNIAFTASEVINPERNVARAMAFGTILVTLIYVLANVAYILLLPVVGLPDGGNELARGIQFATSDRVGTAAASEIFGGASATIMAVLIMISTFGCNNGLILAGARVYYAMSKDGLFFKKAGSLNEHSVPGWALVAQSIWASVLCLSGTYGDLLDYVIFAVLIFYILTVVGIFVLRKKRPLAPRPYKAFGYPVMPALYVIVASAIAIDLLIFKPQYTWPGLGIVLLGIPVFFIWRRKQTA